MINKKEQILNKYNQIFDVFDSQGEQAESIHSLMSDTAKDIMAEQSVDNFQTIKKVFEEKFGPKVNLTLFDNSYHVGNIKSLTGEVGMMQPRSGEIIFRCLLEVPRHGYWLWVAEQLVKNGQLGYPGVIDNFLENKLRQLTLESVKTCELFDTLSEMAENIYQSLQETCLNSINVEPKILDVFKGELKDLTTKMILIGYGVARIEEPFRNKQKFYTSGV